MTDAQRPDAFLDGLFAAIDAMDVTRFADYLTDDCRFRFGSAPRVEGREAVAQAVAGFFASIAGISHSLTRVIVDGNVIVCEGEVCYRRHDTSELVLPFVTVFHTTDGRIADYRIYIDIAPLYST